MELLLRNKVQLEGSNIRILEEDMIDVFLMIIIDVASSSGIDSNMLEVLPSWKSVVLKKTYESSEFVTNVELPNPLEVSVPGDGVVGGGFTNSLVGCSH